MNTTLKYGDLTVALTKKEQNFFTNTMTLCSAMADLNLPEDIREKGKAAAKAIDLVLKAASVFPKQKALPGLEDHVKETE